MTNQTEQFMHRAIELARKGLGRTAPNPPVGAVLVMDGRIVGEGFHPAAGMPHAEIYALQDAGDASRGAEIYVTLEPCCHQGRTGPCVDALINACVAKVYVGTLDPNPKVSGRGVEILRQAGIEVVTDVLHEECRQLIAPFAKHVTTGMPYVVFKAAMTLDGQIATAAGDSQWISCEASRERVHQLRNHVDGIMVGSGTVKSDNPKLTTRLPQGGRDALRVVFDSSLSTDPESTIYTQRSDAKTLLITTDTHTKEALQRYCLPGVEVAPVGEVDGQIDLTTALVELGQRDLQYLLLEGGSTLGGAMMRAGLVDRVMIFIAPKMLGGVGRSLFAGEGASTIAESCQLLNLRVNQVDTDILIEGDVQHVHRPD